jgi:hypothetical protein
MIDMPDRPYVHMRLLSLKPRLRHRSRSFSALTSRDIFA